MDSALLSELMASPIYPWALVDVCYEVKRSLGMRKPADLYEVFRRFRHPCEEQERQQYEAKANDLSVDPMLGDVFEVDAQKRHG